jgi:hypothetical protein
VWYDDGDTAQKEGRMAIEWDTTDRDSTDISQRMNRR